MQTSPLWKRPFNREGKHFNFRHKENLSVFTQLGLTIRQAQVYLANAQLGQATAKTISKHVQADRAEIYRAIIKLEKLGLVQRHITNPVTFKAAPITEAFSILLQQNAEKHNQIQNEAKKFIKEYRKSTPEELKGEGTQRRLTSGLKSGIRELAKDIANIQTSSDTIMDWRGRLFSLNTHFEQLKKVLERGVKIRCITEVPENMEIPQIIQILKETGHFEIKSASTPQKAGIDIHDKKSVHFISIPNNNLKGIEVLRINDPNIVELAQDYFDLKWQTATTPCWRKKNHQTKPS
jgi:sugar-specific transcriptional regulator TrmB